MKAVFACGGTGGHIYPAIALAEEFLRKNSGNEALFIGSVNGMEKGIIEGRGFRFAGVDARPLIRKFTFKNVINGFYIIKSLFDAAGIVKKFNPDFAAGTGGFVSFPAIMAASLMGKRALIHEPNIVPGLANRMLSFFAAAITVGFGDTLKYFPKGKTHLTGNPLRESILARRTAAGYRKFGLTPGKKTVLIMPGSRAAKSVNLAVTEALPLIEKEIKGAQVIWMTGADDHAKAAAAARQRKTLKIAVMKFINDAGAAYSIADAGILRAGASTLTELAALRLPSVLVPYPHATANHQEKNAMVLEGKGAAIVIKDAGLTARNLTDALKKALDKKTAASMKKALKKVYQGNSAGKIVKILTGEVR